MSLCAPRAKYPVDHRHVGTSDEISEMSFVANIDIEDALVTSTTATHDPQTPSDRTYALLFATMMASAFVNSSL